MLGLFKKKNRELQAVVDGKFVNIESVNDETFAQKLMGDGVAIIPCNNVVYAPCDGRVMVLPSSNHAVGLLIDDEIELLIHIGIDTVNLQGKGFEALVNVDQEIKKGQPLIKFDQNYLQDDQIDMTTMIILLNKGNSNFEFAKTNNQMVSSIDVIATIK